MSRQTSFDELYTVLGGLVNRATGRRWWRRAGMQAQPTGTYVLANLSTMRGNAQQIVSSVELDEPRETGEVFTQIPWNSGEIDVVLEFYRSAPGDTALQAATRATQALRLEERFWDLWEICGLAGGVELVDVAAIFRGTIEPRVEVRFSVVANVAEPLPLQDADIFDIDTQRVDVLHYRQGENTPDEIVVEIENTEN